MRHTASRRDALLLAFASTLALAGCGSGSSSQSSLLACSTPKPAASSASQPFQVFELGTRQVGTTVTFSAPAGAASITIVEQIVSAPANATFTDQGTVPNSAVPLKVTEPNGTVIFDEFQNPADPTAASLFFGSFSPGAGTLTLPNTTAGLNLVSTGLPQGTWSFVVSDLAHVCTLASNCAANGGSATSTYDVTVVVKPGAGADNIPATGAIDVTFNLTPSGSPPLSAATAGTDPDLQRLVSSLEVLLGRAGLTLGTVRYVDVPATVSAKDAPGVHIDDLTVCGDLQQLLATAPHGRQVNIFLVSTFISSDSVRGASIVGVDGTIPGPATVSPNLQSGVAVSVVDLRAGTSNCGANLALNCGSGTSGITCCGADVTAYVTAHEIGHFLGLYHVTERDGTSFDPLQDTPMCPCQSCALDPTKCADAKPPPATPHDMTIAECEASTTCGGGDNLMFWLFGNGSVGNLSPEQQRVMRANPAVY